MPNLLLNVFIKDFAFNFCHTRYNFLAGDGQIIKIILENNCSTRKRFVQFVTTQVVEGLFAAGRFG